MAIQIKGSEDDAVSSINTTPLVDVMLVLLIIFLITIPVATHAVKVTLPIESATPREASKEVISVSVDRNGKIYWDAELVSDANELARRLAMLSKSKSQPMIQIHGDQETRYEYIAAVVDETRNAGIRRVSFITEPAWSN